MTGITGVPTRAWVAVVAACAALLLLVGLASNAAPMSIGNESRADELVQPKPLSESQTDDSDLIPEQRISEDPVVFPPYVDAAIAVIALALSAVAVVMLLRSHLIRWRLLSWARPGRATMTAEPASEAEVADRLATAAAEMRQGLLDGDARLAVQRCYALVESGFGADDLARHASETPLQYLHRIFGADVDSAGVDQPLRRLTSLFERARFSDQSITEAMRSDAAEALGQIERHYRSRAEATLTAP